MGDYKTAKEILLDKSLVSTPDMGEYLDNDDIMKLTSSIVEGSDGGAYFIENPFSTELGYHEAENVFVVSAKPCLVVDGDTADIQYSDIQDGGKPFVFLGDGKEYDCVKDYIYQTQDLDKVSDKISIRFLGINAPEVPHCRTTYVANNYQTVYAKFGDLTGDDTSATLYTDIDCTKIYKSIDVSQCGFIYFKYGYKTSSDGYTIEAEYKGQRADDDVVKFIVNQAHTDNKGIIEVYYEIMQELENKSSLDSVPASL